MQLVSLQMTWPLDKDIPTSLVSNINLYLPVQCPCLPSPLGVYLPVWNQSAGLWLWKTAFWLPSSNSAQAIPCSLKLPRFLPPALEWLILDTSSAGKLLTFPHSRISRGS